MTNFDMLTGKKAEEFMKKIIKDHEDLVNNNPDYYSKFGYKWNNETTKYRWVEGMREISGFGETLKGNGQFYEECCRFMVTKGLEFIDEMKKEYPDTDPKFGRLEGKTKQGEQVKFFGFTQAMNKGAEELQKYICWKVEDYFGKYFGPSSAQMHAATNHIQWILTHSWDEYVKKMKEKE